MTLTKDLEYVQYTPEHYQDVNALWQTFAPENGAPDHFYFSRQMYEWLFKGFGSEHYTSLLLYKGDELIGCRGAQPGLFQVPVSDGSYVIEKGNGLTGWAYRQDMTGIPGLGLKLHMRVQESLPVVTSCFFGHWSDRNAINITGQAFKASKFSQLDALHRYVMPIDQYGYTQLLSEPVLQAEVESWVGHVDQRLKGISTCNPVSLSAESLETLWKKISDSTPIFSVHKTAEYWRWRYLECPNYEYLMWGDPQGLGVVVGRVDRVFSRVGNGYDFNHPLHGQKVLRIIELLPVRQDAWQGSLCPSFDRLVGPVIKWCKQEGCLAADFQCSSGRFEKSLLEIGFKEQNSEYGPAICSLAGLFGPFRYKPDPINAAWRVKSLNHPIIPIDASDTHFVKSDVAGDYPKFWPLPETWE